ncbi:MAG TPA: PAS domain-containing protein, partial [Actinomycetota bacterium]
MRAETVSPSHRPPDADVARETAGLSERYRALLERTPAAVYARVEIGGRRTTYRSSRIEPILGYPAAALDRAAWLSLIDDDDRDRVLMAEGRADSTKDPFAEEYRMGAADGRTVWIRDEAEWVPGVAGEPAHWLGVLTDVTERHDLRRELREATGRFRTLIEQLPAVTYLDLPGESMTDVHVSSQLRELFGVAEDGAELGEWPERVHAEDRERATKESLLAARSGEPGPIEYRMVRRDGEVVWIREVATVIRDDDGEPTAVQGVLLDVTAQKTLEQELRETAARFRTLVEQIPAVVYVDPLGPEPSAPRYVSPYVETMFGITPGEATGDPEWWTGRLHPEDRDEAIRTAREASARGGPYRNDYRIVRPSGEVVWVRDEAVAVRDDDGRPRFWQGVMYDITDRKRAEQDLRQALALERDAVERLREADELKDTFLTAVSHDLRTPLSTILGIAVTLEHEDEVPLDPADRRALLQSLNAKARELTDLVTDLLDLDRLRRGVTEAQLRVEALHEL